MRATSVLIASAVLAVSACSPNGQTATSTAGETTTTSSREPASTAPVDDTAAIDDDRDADGTAATGGGGPFPRALSPFADCSAFLDHVKAAASERVGPYGLQHDPWGHVWGGDVVDEMSEDMAEEMSMDMAEGDDMADAPASAPASDDSGDSGDSGVVTGTNVQELGVDEPDIVKTDGTRIITISENRLAYIDVTGEPTLTDTLTLPEGWGHELFIRGDRALLFTNGGEWLQPVALDDTDGAATADAEAEFADDVAIDSIIEPGWHHPAALIIDVDLSDPADLRIASTMRIEGQYLSARAIDDRVRLAVTSPPNRLPWLVPQNSNGEERAEQANRGIVAESTIDDWLPSYLLERDGADPITGSLLACDRAHRPAEFSGFDMVSIVDLDLTTGLAGAADRIDAVGVMASGQTVYSSTDRMYVATTRWVAPGSTGDSVALQVWD